MSEQKTQAVLIVDDQPSWRSFLSDVLEEEYEVTAVGSYEDALVALDRDPPFHVAVLDIRLDDKKQVNEEGLRLAETINEKGEHTNIIIVTGYATVRTARRALHHLAVFDYIEKCPVGSQMFEGGQAFDFSGFRKTVRLAADDAEKRRPRPFVRRGNRVLIMEDNGVLREKLVSILRQDGYDVEGLSIPSELGQRLTKKTFDLVVLKQDAQLIARVREHQPNARIVAMISADVGDAVRRLRNEAIQGVVTITDGEISLQEFRETVRSLFAFASNKYICAWLEGIPDTGSPYLGQPCVLVLSLQDVPELGKETISVWLPPGAERRLERILKLSFWAPEIKVRAGREAFWEIPPLGNPPLFRTEVIPQASGEHTITIDIECEQAWLGRLKQVIKVTDKPSFSGA